MSDDLVAFLRACIDDDEQIAHDAGGRWEPLFDAWVNTTPTGKWEPSGSDRHVAVVVRSYDREHIVRHDPARVIAEVDAKRGIVNLHARAHECSILDGRGDIDGYAFILNGDACTTLRLLALPYAGREGYRPEWAPEA